MGSVTLIIRSVLGFFACSIVRQGGRMAFILIIRAVNNGKYRVFIKHDLYKNISNGINSSISYISVQYNLYSNLPIPLSTLFYPFQS